MVSTCHAYYNEKFREKCRKKKIGSLLLQCSQNVKSEWFIFVVKSFPNTNCKERAIWLKIILDDACSFNY